jgi:hypothetical protein
VHSWQYDQGAAVQWTALAEKEELWRAKASIINGDGGFGMTNSATRIFHNSSPGWAATGEVYPLRFFEASKEFRQTFGDFGFEISFVDAARGSYPGAKRPVNHLLAGVKWMRQVFGDCELALRGSVGEFERGLTDFPIEKTQGWVIEACLNNIPIGKSSLTPYGYISGFEYVEGYKNELWLPGTSHQDQYGIGMRLDHPFGWRNVYFSAGAAFRNMDGEDKWPILQRGDVYVLNAGIMF